MNFETRVCRHTPALRYMAGEGSGPALLLLHGVTRCGGDWEQLLPELAREWRIFALDQRGHGGSGRAESYLVTDYVADAVHFVRHEIAAPVVIVGHSLGAMTAAAVAAELPEQVRAVVLEDPPFHTMGERIHGTAWQAQFVGMQAVARLGGCSVEKLTDVLAEIRLPTPEGGFRRLGDLRDHASLRWSAECVAQLDPEVLTPVIAGRWLEGYDHADVFERMRCPVLLLQADAKAGGALMDDDVQLALRSISDCRHVSFAGVSHQIHRQRPEEMLRVVREFVATLPPSGRSAVQCVSGL